ncbi:CidA/LrgA family protein [Thermaerobacillus caldiproteolyticus]|uniref:Holin-like protein n=2 Tax=Thermaerobacillus caldiproteolyticus TaxID=247480 RepID=A0A7V9Z4H6_9BACL|nr:CidA/LrgA family protein [Anoxybacillus caldiproteolyticus]MBA2873860.1 holin-like protein [Anoxybacillus caldiproteolyticus]QPA33256.1 CidA/LrgA family protein [Anoxybacillus caldiproteolyticus]
MKRAIVVILQIAGLYGFYLIGTWIQHLFHLLIPGSIIGMILLFLLLITNIIKEEWLGQGGKFLLAHLPLLFVPATVGVIEYISLFQGQGVLSIVDVIVSTIIVMVLSGAIGQWRARKETASPLGNKVSRGMEG